MDEFTMGERGLYFSMNFLKDFHRRQMELWPLAAQNYSALERVDTRNLEIDGFTFRLQHNPARILSSAAKVDAASVAVRPCFLCAGNRPAEQLKIVFEDHRDDYELLVNPYPICPLHFTIPARTHTPQLIASAEVCRFSDMLLIARRMPGMAVFYNGPRCGASAPDHLHFQAVEASRLPLLEALEENPASIPFEVRYILADRVEDALWEFVSIVDSLRERPENRFEEEPMMNIFATYVDGEYRAVVIPRRGHRPDFYGAGEGQVLMSPASLDLAGLLVVPSPRDYSTLDEPTLRRMLSQITFFH